MQFADEPRIAVIGLGYVGLPLAVALARHFEASGRARLRYDRTREVKVDRLAGASLKGRVQNLARPRIPRQTRQMSSMSAVPRR